MTVHTLWTATEAAQATGGETTAEWFATGIGSDSRGTALGDLYVALKGPRFDGHDFVSEALSRGAVAALVSRRPDKVGPDAPLLIVDDTYAALERLAQEARERSSARIVAITGSVGKSGTKEALKRAFAEQGLVVASPASFNNRIGVPLSLAALPAAARFGVFEIGMNRAGEITPLTCLVKPHVAVITGVAPVHLEFFGSVADIAAAKEEIFAGLDDEGIAVLNRDDSFYEQQVEACRRRGITRIIDFGAHLKSRVRLLEARCSVDHSRVEAAIDGHKISYKVGAPGHHWVINSLTVLAAAKAAGADVAGAAASLAKLPLLPGRGVRHRIALPGGDLTLIDESYNANPVSMRAAIEILGATPSGMRGRRIAILGDMLELGATAAVLHAELAEPLLSCGVDRVFTAGAHMSCLHDALPAAKRGGHAARADDLVPLVKSAVRGGDVVMVKGSFATGMGRVVSALAALGAENELGAARNG